MNDPCDLYNWNKKIKKVDEKCGKINADHKFEIFYLRLKYKTSRSFPSGKQP